MKNTEIYLTGGTMCPEFEQHKHCPNGRGILKNYQPSKLVTSMEEIKIGAVLVMYSRQFDAVNTVQVTALPFPHGRIFYYTYINGTREMACWDWEFCDRATAPEYQGREDGWVYRNGSRHFLCNSPESARLHAGQLNFFAENPLPIP